MSAAATAARREELHHRGGRLEVFTVAWNAVEGVVAIGAGIATGSVSLIGFGADSFIEVISAVALLWRLRKAGPNASVVRRRRSWRRRRSRNPLLRKDEYPERGGRLPGA